MNSKNRKKRFIWDIRLLPLQFWRWWGMGVVIVVLFLIGFQRPAANPFAEDDFARYHQQCCRVIEVVDGDTLQVDVPDPLTGQDTTRIRLWGVDTPETRHPEKGVMYFGPEAAEFTRYCALDQTVELILEPNQSSRDRYQRLLAYVLLPDGSVLNENLIRKGYGYADSRFDHVLRDRFIELQKQARREKAGLWREVQPEQYPDWFED